MQEIEHIIPRSHPRYHSLITREHLVKGFYEGIVVPQGLIAHGRGECFDYLIGEKTIPPARKAIRAAAALLLLARYPVISVNGNTAVLAGRDIVKLAKTLGAAIEVSLFYRTRERAVKIAELLKSYGAENVYGVDDAIMRIPGLEHPRGLVSPNGIWKADVVLVPLEDGDRTQALRKIGKKVIAIDLNPLSRTALSADITIVDNVTRAIPLLIEEVEELKSMDRSQLEQMVSSYNNLEVLEETLNYIVDRLRSLARDGLKQLINKQLG